MAIGYGASDKQIADYVISAALKLEDYPVVQNMSQVVLEAVRATRDDSASNYDNMMAALRHLGWIK